MTPDDIKRDEQAARARMLPVIARLTGRCANGAERDGGRRSHVVMIDPHRQLTPSWETAVCGAKPGRLSNGWDEVDGAENPTCPRCRARLERRS